MISYSDLLLPSLYMYDAATSFVTSEFVPLSQGEFLLTYQIMEHRYGLSLQAIESVAENGLACVITMELEVSYTWHLNLCYFDPPLGGINSGIIKCIYLEINLGDPIEIMEEHEQKGNPCKALKSQ